MRPPRRFRLTGTCCCHGLLCGIVCVWWCIVVWGALHGYRRRVQCSDDCNVRTETWAPFALQQWCRYRFKTSSNNFGFRIHETAMATANTCVLNSIPPVLAVGSSSAAPFTSSDSILPWRPGSNSITIGVESPRLAAAILRCVCAQFLFSGWFQGLPQFLSTPPPDALKFYCGTSKPRHFLFPPPKTADPRRWTTENRRPFLPAAVQVSSADRLIRDVGRHKLGKECEQGRGRRTG